jgi:transposase
VPWPGDDDLQEGEGCKFVAFERGLTLVLAPYQRPVGRPSTITPELVTALVEDVGSGLSFFWASKRRGLSHQRTLRWKQKGEQLMASEELDVSRLTEAECLYVRLARDVGITQAEFELAQIRRLLRDGGGDWRAPAWVLERRFPERWGRQARLRVDAVYSAPPAVSVEPVEGRLRALFEYGREQGWLQEEGRPSIEPPATTEVVRADVAVSTAADPMCEQGFHIRHPEKRGYCVAWPKCDAYTTHGWPQTLFGD